MPTSSPRRGIWVSVQRQRSTKGCRGLSLGTATITACDAAGSAQQVDQGPEVRLGIRRDVDQRAVGEQRDKEGDQQDRQDMPARERRSGRGWSAIFEGHGNRYRSCWFHLRTDLTR